MFHMQLGRFRRMVSCMMMVSAGCMRVMSRSFVVACLMVPGRMAVMFRRALVVLRRLMMVLGCLLRHILLLVPFWIVRVAH